MNAPTKNLPATRPATKSVTLAMADRYGMEPQRFEQTLRKTVFPANGTPEQFAAFMLVANTYDLNPITKEIYAFPAKGGGIVPIVSIDGWCNLVNSHPQMDGMTFEEHLNDEGELHATTCSIYRKDRKHPIQVTEYYAECKRATDPWKMKHRMLRHKAMIQCARYAFGFAGVYDEDEGRLIAQSGNDSPPSLPPAPPPDEPAPAKDEIQDADYSEADTGPEQDFTAICDDFEAATKACETFDLLDEHMDQIEPHMNGMPQALRTRCQNAYEAAQERLQKAAAIEAADEKDAAEKARAAAEAATVSKAPPTPPADDDFPGDRPSKDADPARSADYVARDAQLAENGDADAELRVMARSKATRGPAALKRWIGGLPDDQAAIVTAMPDYRDLAGL